MTNIQQIRSHLAPIMDHLSSEEEWFLNFLFAKTQSSDSVNHGSYLRLLKRYDLMFLLFQRTGENIPSLQLPKHLRLITYIFENLCRNDIKNLRFLNNTTNAVPERDFLESFLNKSTADQLQQLTTIGHHELCTMIRNVTQYDTNINTIVVSGNAIQIGNGNTMIIKSAEPKIKKQITDEATKCGLTVKMINHRPLTYSFSCTSCAFKKECCDPISVDLFMLHLPTCAYLLKTRGEKFIAWFKDITGTP